MFLTRRAGFVALAVVLGMLVRPANSQPKADPNVAPSDPLAPEEQRKKFRLPEGFEIQLVAAEPDVRKPINLNFDARGRLWVTESVEYPFPAGDKAKHRDTIRILDDTDGDGRADVVTTFTDGLNIPIGVLPLSRGAIAHSIPKVWMLHDKDGDDKADGKDALLESIGFQDTHGMTGEFSWGFDGFVYACHGYANTSELEARDGSKIIMQSGNTYRFRPDGTRLEQWTWGQVNPFGLAFDPLGNLFSCDCHSRPLYQLLRGAYYPSFGKPHDGLGFGPEMMTHSHGSTAICGLAYYAADHFPAEYRDTLFVGNVMTHRINHDRLERRGSTLLAKELPDFLRCDDPWFRPVDIKLGPDGALYVADFYNRIIGHYEVPLDHPGRDRERGRVWRIVWKGKDGKGKNPTRPRKDWRQATIAELCGDLGHPNLAVRILAANQLVERANDDELNSVVKVLEAESKPVQRAHAAWVLERRTRLDDRAVERLAGDADPLARVHLMKILAERKKLTDGERRLVVKATRDGDAFVRRAAADALGRHPALDHLRPLIELHATVDEADTHLRHVVRMALRDQLRDDAVWARLPEEASSDRGRRAILDVAVGVPSAPAAAFLLGNLEGQKTLRDELAPLVQHVARHADAGSLDRLVAVVLERRPDTIAGEIALLKAASQGLQSRGAKTPVKVADWSVDLARRAIASGNDRDVLAGIELAGAMKLEPLRDRLADLLANRKVDEGRRSASAQSLAAIDPAGAVEPLAKILGDSAEPITLREKTASTLASLNSAKSREALLTAFAAAPQRLSLTIAGGLAGSKEGADQLLTAVASGKASARLLLERQVESRLRRANPPDFKSRFAKLTENLPPIDDKVRALVTKRAAGFAKASASADVGAKVFEKHCAACHQVANKGAKIGPQLDGVGVRGVDRLLEDLLDPNRNVDQAFRITTLTLGNGQVISGLLLRQEGETLVLADHQGKEIRVQAKLVEEREASQLSPMPANLVEQMPEGELFDLLAFLLAQRPTK